MVGFKERKAMKIRMLFAVLVIYAFSSSAFAGPTNSYIKVTGFNSVTNGAGGFNYLMGIEYYSSSTNSFSANGEVNTNLVNGLWTNDLSKVSYVSGSLSISNTVIGKIYSAKFLCIGSSSNRFFRPILYER